MKLTGSRMETLSAPHFLEQFQYYRKCILMSMHSIQIITKTVFQELKVRFMLWINKAVHSPTVIDLDAVKGWWRRRDSNPLGDNNLHNAELLQNTYTNATIPCETKQLRQQEFSPEIKTLTLSEHKTDTSLQKKCAVCVHIENVPLDLKLIMNAWPDLPKELRLQIAKVVLEAII